VRGSDGSPYLGNYGVLGSECARSSSVIRLKYLKSSWRIPRNLERKEQGGAEIRKAPLGYAMK